MVTKYISIKSILFELSLLIDDRYWNEFKFLEFLYRGAKSLNIIAKYITKTEILKVEDHKAVLPSDLISIDSIAYTTTNLNKDCCEKTNVNWKAMRASTGFLKSSMCSISLPQCVDCTESFSVDENLIVTTSFKEGYLLITYKSYPIDNEGILLIPDDPNVREALLHFSLYKYWMVKFQMKEEGADTRMKYHYDMWSILSKKALSLNLPDVATLENIKEYNNALHKRGNAYQKLFIDLSNTYYE